MRWSCRGKFKTESPTFRHIIWIQTSFLGDIIINTAAMALCKEKFPHSKQILITTQIGGEALQGEPYLDHILIFDKRKEGSLSAFKKLALELKNLGCRKEDSVVLLPHRSFRSALLAVYINLPRIGYKESPASCLYSLAIPRISVLHEAARIGLLLEPLGCTREEILQARPLLSPKEGPALRHSPTQKLIGIAPGSKWGTKMWPTEKYAELVTQLSADKQNQIILLGSPDEKKLAEEIMTTVGPRSNVTNLVGTTRLRELKSLYPQLDILVTNDSSPLHYASAYNVPTVAIFGATVPGLGFGPLAEKSTLVEHHNLPCRPCSDHGPMTCPLGHFRCMKEISAADVLQAIQSTY